MPFSTPIFKKETIEFIQTNFSTHCNILDIGAGAGIYSDLLKSEFNNIDAVEIFEPYVEQYNLKNKYRKVFTDNILSDNIDIENYDLFILGDVLEHIDVNDAKQLLKKLFSTGAEIIVTVPFDAPQEESFGNIYERHLQSKLSFANVLKLYPELSPLCVRYDYGVFITNRNKNKYFPVFYKDVDDGFVEKLKLSFPYKMIINTDEEIKSENYLTLFDEEIKSDVTIVTGLWNMGRGELNNDFTRSYEDYKDRFIKLLKSPINMFIYVSKEDEEFIWKHRSRQNTFVKVIELSEFDTWFEFFDKVQDIRNTPSWHSQADWLSNSPQARLKYYNPVVMSKMFLLNNATLFNPFNNTNFFWIDAGITNTVHEGYFTHDKVFNKLPKVAEHLGKLIFLSYPYEDGAEIHGFPRLAISKWANSKHVKYVCRGGFFGGAKETINAANAIYYSVLRDTLFQNHMGTEESIFTIIAHLYPELVYRFELSDNGMVWPFFEALKDVDKFITTVPKKTTSYKDVKTNIYVLGYNSPEQFAMVCEAMKTGDPEMFSLTRKILLNNSTDEKTFAEYDRLCSQYGFEEIHSDNIGICGGRQFVAEHFAASDAEYYMFFEDDMLVNDHTNIDKLCKSGLRTYVPNLYQNLIRTMMRENFDFLKVSYSEFYGDNGTQWAWYNVPQNVRTDLWPEYDKLPEQGLDPNAPRTALQHIKTFNGLSYATGQIYYSNWPMIVSRTGNQKMFLDTKWAHPYEQTWMSYMFQETLKGNLKPAVLLASPINHNRIAHYKPEERREN